MRVAQAAAILGPGAELRHVAAIADVELDGTVAAVDALADAGILEDARPISFVHPIVRTAIERDLAAGARSGLHGRAARMLAGERGRHGKAALHLLETEPVGDRWVVETLRASAENAIVQGAPRSAVSYLRRALVEPPPREDFGGVLRELGFAESYAGDPHAAEHLEGALACSSDAAELVATTLRLGKPCCSSQASMSARSRYTSGR